MISSFATTLAAITIAFIGALHVYWAFGGEWAIANAVPSAEGSPTLRPGPILTSLVAVAFFAMAWLVAIHVGCWFIAAIFALRAIGDFRYIGFFKCVRESRFAQLDTTMYSPLCVVLAVLIALAAGVH